jgi:hypothetical protein
VRREREGAATAIASVARGNGNQHLRQSKREQSPSMTLTSKSFSFAKIFHGVYAATPVSWAVAGVSWATVERNALRIATMILRPPEVSW